MNERETSGSISAVPVPQHAVRAPRPVVANCPGITWRTWGEFGWEARWRPRADLVRRGYPGTPVRLWSGTALSEQELEEMSERCNGLQKDMLVWGRGGVTTLTGAIYFIADGEAIKIGHAMDLKRRLQELQTSHYRDLKIICDLPGTEVDESYFHLRFRHLRIRGEWFRAEPELLAFIEELREELKVAKLPKFMIEMPE